MKNSGNYFGRPACPAEEVVSSLRGKRGLVRFGAHSLRMFAALCVFLAIGMSPAKRALADGGKESLAPKIVQEMQCGSHKVVITCGKAAPGEKIDENDARTCVHNKVKIIDPAGRVSVVPGLGRGTRNPEFMHCGVGRGGKRYVEVLVYSCNMPSCGELVVLTEEGHEIASRITDGNDDSTESRRYDQFMDRNKIRFTKSFGE